MTNQTQTIRRKIKRQPSGNWRWILVDAWGAIYRVGTSRTQPKARTDARHAREQLQLA